jgi:hypothetical protein
MERGVVARGANAFEEVEIELRARDGAGDLGGAGFDSSAVGRQNRDRGLRPPLHADVEVGPFRMDPDEIGVTPVSGIVARHVASTRPARKGCASA